LEFIIMKKKKKPYLISIDRYGFLLFGYK